MSDWISPDDLFDDPEEIDTDDPADGYVPWGAPVPRQRDVGFALRWRRLQEKWRGLQ